MGDPRDYVTHDYVLHRQHWPLTAAEAQVVGRPPRSLADMAVLLERDGAKLEADRRGAGLVGHKARRRVVAVPARALADGGGERANA